MSTDFAFALGLAIGALAMIAVFWARDRNHHRRLREAQAWIDQHEGSMALLKLLAKSGEEKQ